MPIAWIEQAPEPDEREPNPRDRQEIDFEIAAYYEAWECSKRAYLACQQEADELYARLMEED